MPEQNGTTQNSDLLQLLIKAILSNQISTGNNNNQSPSYDVNNLPSLFGTGTQTEQTPTTPAAPVKQGTSSDLSGLFSRLIAPAAKIGINAGFNELTGGQSLTDILGITGGTNIPGMPSGYLPSGNASILGGKLDLGSLGSLNLGELGSMGIGALTSFLGGKTGTPIPGAFANLLMPLVTGVTNPLGWMSSGIGSGAETGKQTSGVVKGIQSVLGALPILGGVISGMLGSTGKTPESPYTYYDPATRGMGQGTQLGEPLDQFDSAARQYQDMIAGIQDMLATQYATKYGFDPSNLKDMGYGPETYSELGVPIQGSAAGQYYKPGVMDYVSTEIENVGGIESLFNPTEKKILANYNALFTTPVGTEGAGPSPYMVYLASQGR